MGRAFPERSDCPDVPDNEEIGTLDLPDPSEPLEDIIETPFFSFPPPEPPSADFGCYGPSVEANLLESSDAAFDVSVEYPTEAETGKCAPNFKFNISIPPCVTASTEASINIDSSLSDPDVAFTATRSPSSPCAYDFRFNLNLPGLCPTVRTEASIAVDPLLSDPTIEFTGDRDEAEPCRFKFKVNIKLPDFEAQDDVCQARMATIGDITLSGMQTIDGIVGDGGDIVLVKDQTYGEDNGAYYMSSGSWERTCDLSRGGVIVTVREGDTNANTAWLLSNNNPIEIGIDPLVFTLISGAACCCYASVATLENITLSGTQIIDGIIVNENDIVLVKNQTAIKQNGPYIVKSGAWVRTCEVNPGHTVTVRKGLIQARTIWMLITEGTIELGTTGLTYQQVIDRPTARVCATFVHSRTGLGICDGVSLNTDDVVLLADQGGTGAGSAQNGLYLAKPTGMWVRAGSITPGMPITIREGRAWGSHIFTLTEYSDNPIVAGSTLLTFKSLRMVIKVDVALDKGPYGQPGVPLSGSQTVDDYFVNVPGVLILVFNSTSASINGVWQTVDSGPWKRILIPNSNNAGMIITVTEGTRFGQVSFLVTGTYSPEYSIRGITGVVGPN
jgi:hypothetical protein